MPHAHANNVDRSTSSAKVRRLSSANARQQQKAFGLSRSHESKQRERFGSSEVNSLKQVSLKEAT